jgi:diguanylate cyclase
MLVNQRRLADHQLKQAISDDRSPATRNASSVQLKLAKNVALLFIAITAIAVPFATHQMPMFQAFFPAYQAVVILSYLLTAYLMQAQFQATGTKSLSYLAAGSLFTAGVLILQLLAFPGAFIEKTQLIGSSQTLTWLWFFWHAGPAVGILFFSYSELRDPGAVATKGALTQFQSLALAAIALFAVGLLVTVFHDALPIMDIKGNYSAIASSGIGLGLEIFLLLALIALWLVSGFKKVLHIWLGLALVALMCDNAITLFGESRLSLGWYLGRFGALLSAIVVPIAYIQEIQRVYLQAANRAEHLSGENAELTLRIDDVRHDALTGLVGRELFMKRANALMEESIKTKAGFATLFIDLDGFKKINDDFGHERGDDVLKRVAEILRSELRGADLAGRIGGDEFIVCLDAPASMSLDIARKIGGRVIDKVGLIGDGIGASIGISLSTISIDHALNQADEAMYISKRNGKNRMTLFHGGLSLVPTESSNLEVQA